MSYLINMDPNLPQSSGDNSTPANNTQPNLTTPDFSQFQGVDPSTISGGGEGQTQTSTPPLMQTVPASSSIPQTPAPPTQIPSMPVYPQPAMVVEPVINPPVTNFDQIQPTAPIQPPPPITPTPVTNFTDSTPYPQSPQSVPTDQPTSSASPTLSTSPASSDFTPVNFDLTNPTSTTTTIVDTPKKSSAGGSCLGYFFVALLFFIIGIVAGIFATPLLSQFNLPFLPNNSHQTAAAPSVLPSPVLNIEPSPQTSTSATMINQFISTDISANSDMMLLTYKLKNIDVSSNRLYTLEYPKNLSIKPIGTNSASLAFTDTASASAQIITLNNAVTNLPFEKIDKTLLNYGSASASAIITKGETTAERELKTLGENKVISLLTNKGNQQIQRYFLMDPQSTNILVYFEITPPTQEMITIIENMIASIQFGETQ